MIDFRKMFFLEESKEKVTDPIELYNYLDRKSNVGQLRKVQEDVLQEWYENRLKEKDLIVKLHTGEGKTLIGLMMLQSKINSGEGPCIYVCPNKYLVEQVGLEANKFGIDFCIIKEDNELPEEFLTGKKILVTYAHKLFNGKSIFEKENINVGTIVLDDSHTCIDVLRDAFTITINRKERKSFYDQILTLFSEDLKKQGEGTFLDIQSGEGDKVMYVPYWAWISKRDDILKIIHSLKNDRDPDNSKTDGIKFVWELIKDKIIECSCFISGDRIEIAPYSVNVKPFRTFTSAKQRILMSATTQEDMFFIKGLNFSIDAVLNPIKSALKWSGEKMILMPSLMCEDFDRNSFIERFAKSKPRRGFGVVAIVPNTKMAKEYEKYGAIFPQSNEDLSYAISKLRKSEFSKTLVINNRYEGIDLPDESCRILLVDSLPFSNSYFDKYEKECRPNSEIINKKIAQKIEQGIGRSVRGEKDYCAIVIIGDELVKFMKGSTNKHFSPQTQKQIEIGLEIVKMAEEVNPHDRSMEQMFDLINYSTIEMFKREDKWKMSYHRKMGSIEESSGVSDRSIYQRYKAEAELEELFSSGKYEEASEATQKFIDEFISDDLERGWFLEQKARYTFMYSREESVHLQRAAFDKNDKLLKTDREMFRHEASMDGNRLKYFRKYINKDKFKDFNEFTSHFYKVLDDFSFGITSDKFESALQEIGEMMGFHSERVDKEKKKGPDNLWHCATSMRYVIFECKSEVGLDRDVITKTESGQFNNHCGWFKDKYGKDAKVLNIIIIPTNKLADNADFTDEVFAMTKKGLNRFKDNIKGFIREVSKYGASIPDEELQKYFNSYKLNIDDFKGNYVEEIRHK